MQNLRKKVEAEYEPVTVTTPHNCHEPKNPQCLSQQIVKQWRLIQENAINLLYLFLFYD
jgi:hypothetical protein